jgi:quercetin dioxygenase-like cupin family protein/DNA-binding Xre family transcriptional regulator
MRDPIQSDETIEGTRRPVRGRERMRYQRSFDVSPPPTAEGPDEIDVGARLRVLRAERSLSIRALAEKSGLNANTLSLIENGKTSPSVSTLQQVAFALQVPIAAFFETDAPRTKVVYQKAGGRPHAAFSHGTMEDMGAGLEGHGAEAFIVTLAPEAESGPDPIVHTGREFVYCLEGRIDYTVAGDTYHLEPGDSLLFEAHQPHNWVNASPIPARSLLVLCPADERDRPTERHFSPE